MPGLLERAIRRRTSREVPRGEPVPLEDEGVSAEERATLLGEIERLVAGRTFLDEGKPRAKSGRRSGARLPVAVNIAAALLLAAGIFASTRAATVTLPGSAGSESTFATTEGLVVQQVQNQANRELSIREQQIASIQAELARLSQAGRTLNPQAAAASDARRAQLEADLARLRSEADVRLASLSQAREQESFFVSQLRSIYQNIGSRFAAMDFESALSGVAAADQLLSDAGAPRGGPGGIAAIAPALLAGDEVLRAAIRYGQSAFTTVGSAQDLARKVTEIDQLVRQGDARFAAGDLEGASAVYTRALAVFASVDRAHNQVEAMLKRQHDAEVGRLAAQLASLRQTVTGLQTLVGEQNQALASQREQIAAQAARIASHEATMAGQEQVIQGQKQELRKRTDELAAVIASVKQGLNSLKTGIAATSGQGKALTSAELTDLLATKITLREAVDSSAVRERYPDLNGKLDSFFRRYGAVYRREGTDAALGTLSAALDTILTSLQAANSAAPAPAQSAASRTSAQHSTDAAVSLYLSRLDDLLAAMLPEQN